jgi:predicted enzyme related to lactoylglutathione lyase
VRVRGYVPATPCWAELLSTDAAASAAFYSDLFGWRPEQLDQAGSDQAGSDQAAQVVWHLGEGATNCAVSGVTQVPPGNQPASWLTYLATGDAAATTKRTVASGGAMLAPLRDVGQRGTLALLADPAGAVFGAWQKNTFAGAQAATEPGTICWSELTTRDRSGSIAFYGEVFGWTERTGEVGEGLDYSEWVCGGRAVAGMVEMDDRFPPEAPAHWRTIFEIEDCAGMAKRCQDLGGQVPLAPMDVGVGTFAQLVDAQGALFGVIELVPELRAMLA